MAGVLVRNWQPDEVRELLRGSEGRRSPLSARPGHAGHRHVDASRQDLCEHADRPSEIELATAFRTFQDQVTAAVAILNHATGQAALAHLEANRGTRRLTLETPIPITIVRCATRHRNWTQPLQAGCMIIDYGSHGRGLHIQTVFPILQFRRGIAAWWQ